MTAPNSATLRQIEAAQPHRSTWLSANAGSGKTKVLTDRVARLLLKGTPPQRILCLTYTKAAAAEMQNRLFQMLGEWAMMRDDDLRAKLEALEPGAAISHAELSHARTLFARAIETPGGLKIQTIHSFCSSLLRRFPLEAGVSPQFKELDDRQKKRLLADTLEEMALGAGRDALDGIATYVSDLGPDAIAATVVGKLQAFTVRADRAEVWSWFDLPEGYDEADAIAEVFLGGEAEILRDAAALMEASPNATDVKNASLFREWSAAMPSVGLISDMVGKLVFGKTTKNPGVSKFGAGVPTKKLVTEQGDHLHALEALMKRIEAVADRIPALEDARRTYALQNFAAVLIPSFLQKKAHFGYLDFDDMIVKAKDLLSRSEVAQWVLFRLDGGIDHILVDEAQDTSPIQWTVIRLLAEEFSAGQGARADVVRTIFVVGDKKQSIYSFQGAAPDAFDEMRDYFDARLAAVGDPLQNLAMEFSFRSSKAILDATDAVFSASNGHGVGGKTHHIAFFDNIPGRVDLWPIIEQAKSTEDPTDWENPVDLDVPEHHTTRLAEQVADHVARLLERGSVPRKKPGEATAIEPGDIMILVRSRSALFHKLIRALKARDLPVAGADRLNLGAELAVKDIRSLLAFLSHQDDDLALAEALKSPIFGWGERDLFRLAYNRQRPTLWQELRARHEEWPRTFDILNDLRRAADFLRPYDLMERVLIRHGGRINFLARLGQEAQDGLDSLLHQARQYEANETPSLTGFISWLDSDDVQIKRVLDETSNLIRVMSVHGSKGLESPIVILPDTLRTDSASRDAIISLDEDRVIWRGSDSSTSREAAEAISAAAVEEERRLLYVAMTRAEKWLIVCGAGKAKDDSDCWYRLVERGLMAAGADRELFPTGAGLRLSHNDWPERVTSDAAVAQHVAAMPVWTQSPAPAIAQTDHRFLSPSDLGGAKALAGEPGVFDTEAAMRRGRQLHLLTEVLPVIPPHERADYAAFLLADGPDAALPDEIPALLAESERVIATEYAWDVFGARSLAEVPFTAKMEGLEGRGVHGIIDRLIVSDDYVQIVDFKTNAIVPDRAEDIPEGLLRQLGCYAEACRQIYPGREIETAILWTRTATLMPVGLNIVMAAMQRASTS